MTDKQRVLFLCTHNSARSQMAEGLLRHLAGDRFNVESAGTEQTRVHPMAIHVMEEMGVDISTQTSKTLDRFVNDQFDYVITVCDQAAEACPIFPGDVKRILWSFDDPSQAAGSDEIQLKTFRRIRDEIMGRLRIFTNVTQRVSH